MRNGVCEAGFDALEPTTVNLHRDGRRSMSGSIANFDDRPSKLPASRRKSAAGVEGYLARSGAAQGGMEADDHSATANFSGTVLWSTARKRKLQVAITDCTASARSGPTFSMDDHPARWWMRNGVS